jgi:predicted acetyltransferase
MVRIVDIERAIETRPHIGGGSAAFTMHVTDQSAPWNEGTWRIEASNGRLHAEKTQAAPDVELTANALAPIYTGFMTPLKAAEVGVMKVNRAEAIEETANAFAVAYPPYCPDWY